jgi:hypothetical protein
MANSMYLNVDGAKGTCLESQHKDWIEIESIVLAEAKRRHSLTALARVPARYRSRTFTSPSKLARKAQFSLVSCVQANTSVRLSYMNQRRVGKIR